MIYRVGDIFRDGFTTYNGSGALTDADATPTGTLIVNGADAADAVPITKVATGDYRVSVPLVGRSVGDICQIRISATVGGVTQKSYKPAFRVESGLGYAVQAGSTATLVTLTVPSGTDPASWATRKLYHVPSGREAVIAAATATGTVATVTLASGWPTPSAGDLAVVLP